MRQPAPHGAWQGDPIVRRRLPQPCAGRCPSREVIPIRARSDHPAVHTGFDRQTWQDITGRQAADLSDPWEPCPPESHCAVTHTRHIGLRQPSASELAKPSASEVFQVLAGKPGAVGAEAHTRPRHVGLPSGQVSAANRPRPRPPAVRVRGLQGPDREAGCRGVRGPRASAARRSPLRPGVRSRGKGVAGHLATSARPESRVP